MENYEILGKIGTGSFGSVTKVRRKKDGRTLVWKEIKYGKMSEKEKQQLVTEVNILRELKNPNIVKYYDRILDKKNTKIYIVMEFCSGGDLGQLIKQCRRDRQYLDEEQIWKVFGQVVQGLHACHTRPEGKIIHRDIKPGNIFLDGNNNVKLGDFGLSRVMGKDSVYAYTHVGTPYYMSPEQITDSKYTEKSDVWSAGWILYEMASLYPPFEAKNHVTLAMKIKEGRVERLPTRYSEELNRTISAMINVDYKRRPSTADLIKLPPIQSVLSGGPPRISDPQPGGIARRGNADPYANAERAPANRAREPENPSREPAKPAREPTNPTREPKYTRGDREIQYQREAPQQKPTTPRDITPREITPREIPGAAPVHNAESSQTNETSKALESLKRELERKQNELDRRAIDLDRRAVDLDRKDVEQRSKEEVLRKKEEDLTTRERQIDTREKEAQRRMEAITPRDRLEPPSFGDDRSARDNLAIERDARALKDYNQDRAKSPINREVNFEKHSPRRERVVERKTKENAYARPRTANPVGRKRPNFEEINKYIAVHKKNYKVR